MVTLSISDYDKRQYRLMLDRLEGFTRGTIRLRQLIDDLYGLLGLLQNPDPAWREAFFGEWETLEEVYSVAMSQGIEMSVNSQRLVREATENMKRFLTDMKVSV